MTSSYFKTVIEVKHFHEYEITKYNTRNINNFIIPVSIRNVLLEKSIAVFSKPSGHK